MKNLLKSLIAIIFLSAFAIFSPDQLLLHTNSVLGYETLPCLIDLRSTFSDGSHSIEELVLLARSKGFKALIINDHDRIAVSYGIPPFRNILHYKSELPSIMIYGPEEYLNEIKRVSEKYPDTIIIPGCETSAYYYWTGSLNRHELILNEYDRRMIIVNLEKAEDYKSIPHLHNNLSLRNTLHLLPGSFLFIAPLFFGIVLLRWKGFFRTMGWIFIIISFLSLLNYNPLRSSLFTQYSGNQGIAPYQELIDYVNEKGALCFWNYPEQMSGIRELEYRLPESIAKIYSWIFKGDLKIHANTPPYARVLVESRGYTGFAALYGDNITAIDPGKEWDMALMDYCHDKRGKPPWGISAADFHEEGRLHLKLGAFPTLLLVDEFSKKGILDSLRSGRFFCARGDGEDWPVIESFYISGENNKEAILGETLTVRVHPTVRFRISNRNRYTKRSIEVMLIRGGELLRTYSGSIPMEIEYRDMSINPGDKTFYRIMDTREQLVSNPIFITYQPG